MGVPQAVARALRAAKNLTGLDVLYWRGDESIPLRATKTQRTGATESDEAVSLDANQADWLVEAADLVIDGRRTEPAERDLVEYLDLTTKARELWRVVAPIGDRHFEPVDPWQNTWRVHTERVNRDD
jgi:hypothetical protein